MPTPDLDRLRERLLRAGVAPRHVQRYLRELREHYDDARSAELARGSSEAAAEHAAWERLGSEDSLAESVLARPELRSTGARFPALVFGAGPALMWLAIVVATATLLRLASSTLASDQVAAGAEPPWGLVAVHALWTLYVRGLPVILGVVALVMAARRRSRVRWPLAGAAVLDVLAGTLSVHFVGSRGLAVNSSLLPWLVPFTDALGPRDLAAFGEGLLRAAVMLAVSATLYAAREHVRVHRRWAA
jgi:hypothetical protein